ncbi:MAG: STAS domain-containing protein [Acidimicrobiales bacterium]
MEESGTPLDLRITVEEATALVRVTGELDLYSADRLRGELARLPGEGVRSIIVDGGGLTFVDSAGLHALVRSRDDAHAKGATIRIGTMSEPLEQVLQMTNLLEVMTQ